MGQFFMPKSLGMVSGLIVGLAIGTGGLETSLLGLFADYWGVPLTLWVIVFIPWAAFVWGAIPYLPSAAQRRPKDKNYKKVKEPPPVHLT